MMAEATHLSEFQYVSRYMPTVFGIRTWVDGINTDPDGDLVTTTLLDSEGAPVFADRVATRVSDGVYEVQLSSYEVSVPGTYELQAFYETGGNEQIFVVPIHVGDSVPAYDSLSPDYKGVVEGVLWKFADLFDSPLGGPHLQVYFQTHFDRGRMAQIMRSAFQKLNVIAQPHTNYGIDNPGVQQEFPLDQWGGLLAQYTFVEAVKHLIRSYTEQPSPSGVTVAYLDRRDYTSRWREILNDEQEDLKLMLDNFKMAHLGLGRPRVLVAGGAFGPSWVQRGMHLNAARPSSYYVRAVP